MKLILDVEIDSCDRQTAEYIIRSLRKTHLKVKGGSVIVDFRNAQIYEGYPYVQNKHQVEE